jgi:hypothetical protein
MAKRRPCKYCDRWITTRLTPNGWLPFEGSKRHYCKAKMKKRKQLSLGAVFSVCAIGVLLLLIAFSLLDR